MGRIAATPTPAATATSNTRHSASRPLVLPLRTEWMADSEPTKAVSTIPSRRAGLTRREFQRESGLIGNDRLVNTLHF